MSKPSKRLVDKTQNFDGVIIETIGLADPAAVAKPFSADEYLKKRRTMMPSKVYSH